MIKRSSIFRSVLITLAFAGYAGCTGEPGADERKAETEADISPAEVEKSEAPIPERQEAGVALDVLLSRKESGFFLLRFDGRKVQEHKLDLLERKGDQFVLGRKDEELPRFRFRVKEEREYLALFMEKAEGDFSGREYGLVFRTAREGLEVVRLNYMARDASGEHQVSLHWPWLWNPNPADPLGAFAIFAPKDDVERDESLAAIWAEGTLPHPDTEEEWTAEQARKWVDRFYNRFAGLSETKLSANSPEELEKLTGWLHRTGIKRVYLHTDTWRGEYWPRKASFVDVNPKVFPMGRESLVAYRRSLEEKGMQLRLHNVSGGIGQSDKEFVLGGAVNPELATWVKGALARPANAKDSEIWFRPEGNVDFPHIRMPRHANLEYFRIGGEILRVKEMEDVDGPVWQLTRVERGLHGTKSASHPEGADVAGLLSAYGQNYVPDTHSPLLGEMADRYARMINEAELDHQHYDGAEIHSYLEPWGFDKFSALVAGKLQRPVTSSTSGGQTVGWNLEYRFSKVKRLKELGYWSMEIPVMLEDHRPATDELDAHFQFADLFLLGATRVGFYKPEPMFGVNAEMLENFGLLPRYEEMVKEWHEVLPLLGEREKAWLSTLLQPVPKDRLRQRGNHWQSQDVPVLERDEKGFAFVPVRVLHRKGVDGIWMHGQEFGPVGPRQYLQPGENVVLSNPYAAQPPELSLQVLPAVARGGHPQQEAAGSGESVGDEVLESYRTGADLAGRKEPGMAQGRASRRLWPASSKSIVQAGFTRLELQPGVLSLSAANPTGEPIWEERDLPSWAAHLPIRGRRAIALEIEGDGSGAVLVLQLTARGTRDYVVKLDFKGARRIVIPSGEVAWSAAYWGWRFDAKHFNYNATISTVRLGFGYLPPNTTPKVKVTTLEILDEVPGGLKNPVIRIGSGELRVSGEVNPGEYLTYTSERGVRVFDRNWNFLRTMAHETQNWRAPKGDVPVIIETAAQGALPWIALRITTRGEPFRIAHSNSKQ